MIFGMAWTGAVELSERLDVVKVTEAGRASRLRIHRLRLGQIQERVKQHRGVPRREDEAIAVRPDRVGRIEIQPLLP